MKLKSLTYDQYLSEGCHGSISIYAIAFFSWPWQWLIGMDSKRQPQENDNDVTRVSFRYIFVTFENTDDCGIAYD